jgi:triosephosphate isomerase (TIM)
MFTRVPLTSRRRQSANATSLLASVTAGAIGATAATAYLYMCMRRRQRDTVTCSRPKGSTNEVPMKDGERKYLIGGNWKCNGTIAENEALIKVFNEAGPIPSNVEVAICASYIHLPMLLSGLRSDIAVGAQDCGVNSAAGAFTGEVGAFQIKDLGCVWVIIGHSERREGFEMGGEPVEVCAKKCKVALQAGLNVMFAIGEKHEERENGTTMAVCASQLEPLAKILDESEWEKVAIAYEPVWAIGSGLTATPEMAQETHKSIRDWIGTNVSERVAKAIRIQYGGSMKGANAKDLLAQPDIDGGLIGGASLTADFFNVINAVL